MENVEELKKTVEIFEAELKELEEKLKARNPMDCPVRTLSIDF